MGKGKSDKKKRGDDDSDCGVDGRGGGRLEDFSDVEVDSKFSEFAAEAGLARVRPDLLPDEFVAAVGDLTEKASAKRLKALVIILRTLRSGVDFSDQLFSYRGDLTDSLLQILRRQDGEQEGILAIQIACIYGLVVGLDDDDYVQAFDERLRYVATRSSFEYLRRWAVTGLSFIAYICSANINLSVWNFCADVMCKTSEALEPSPGLQAAAADAWTLLSSRMNPEAVVSESRGRVFASLTALMQVTETDVKVSGGENLAFLWEAAVEVHPELLSAPADEIGNALCEDEDQVALAIRLVNDISRESSRKVSKKDRKEQRAAFRHLLMWIVRGERPEESIRLGGGTVEASTFARMRLFETLRMVLADAFQTSLRAFPILRVLLDVDDFTPDHMDGGGEERRVEKGSAKSKQRTNQRNAQRGYKSFVTGEV